MMTRRCNLTFVTCLGLVFASMAAGQENDNHRAPRRFRDLFVVGQTVLLRTSANNPLYTIQLLSDEQAKQIKERDVKQAEAEQRMSKLAKLLEEEQSLEKFAALLKEQQEIQSRRSRQLSSRRMIGTPYGVTHVGADYVALNRSESERFVPYRSIRSMYRSENLILADRTFVNRDRTPRGTASKQQITRIQLRNVPAAEMAEVIRKLYSDVKLKINVKSAANTLELESQGAELRSIERLIEAVDSKAETSTGAEDDLSGNSHAGGND